MSCQASFVIGLKASAARVETADSRRLAHRMLATYGQAEIYEWIHARDVGKVAFDVDGRASETTAEALLRLALEGVATFFGFTPTHVIVSQAHGGDKLSYRIYVVGYRMRIADVKARLLRLGLDDRHGGPFDPAIYGTNQKLRCTGSQKTRADPRPLQLVDLDGRPVAPTEDLLHHTLVQVVDDEWPLLEEPPAGPTRAQAQATGSEAAANTAATSRPGAKRAAPPTGVTPPAAPTSPEDQPLPRAKRARTSTCKPRDRRVCESALRTAGFSAISWLNDRNDSFTFSCDRTTDCRCCGGHHDHQNWSAAEDSLGRLHVKSYSPSCRTLVLDPEPRAAGGDVSQAIVTITDNLRHIEEDVAQVKHALYTVNDYVARQQPVIDSTLATAVARVTRLSDDGFHFTCQDVPWNYKCEALIQTCCRISSDQPDSAPVIAGYQTATLLKQLVGNPKGGDAIYAQWVIQDQADRGIAWRYDDARDQLYRSAGVRWEPTSDHVFLATFDGMARARLRCVVNAIPTVEPRPDRDVVRSLHQALQHVEGSRASKGMLASAKLQLTSVGFAASLDTHPHLLGAADCVIDLRTGERAEMGLPVSMTVRPPFKGVDHPTPGVHAFFMSLFNDDADMVDYLRRFLGMTLCGEGAQVYGCFVGCGSNGKSLTLEWLRHVLGDYYLIASPHIFFADKTAGNTATPYVAELDRKRLAVVEESGKHDTINVELIKRLTGSANVNVRRLYQEPFTMKVMHTQVLCTNSLPKFDVDDAAMRRRIVVVPFDMQFKDADALDAANPLHRPADPELKARLMADDLTEQLLSWLVSGCRDFYAGGRAPPAKPPRVKRAEAEYTEDNDVLGQLLEEHCTIGQGLQVEAVAFNAIAKGVVKTIRGAMEGRGFPLKKCRVDGRQVKIYAGLALKDDA